MCLIANNFGLQEENINISKPQGKPLIRKTSWVSQKEERQSDRWTETERKGREGAVIYEKGG